MTTLATLKSRNLLAIALAIGTFIGSAAHAQRVGPPVALPTIAKDSCDMELRPQSPIDQDPSFLVISYKPAGGTAGLEAEVVTSSGSQAFDEAVLHRLRRCNFQYKAGPPRGSKGLLLLPVRDGLGVRPPSLSASSPLPPCIPGNDDYPFKARREDRSGTVSVKVVGTEAGHLARIELSVSSGQLDFDQAALTRAANCAKTGAKPGSNETTMRWTIE